MLSAVFAVQIRLEEFHGFSETHVFVQKEHPPFRYGDNILNRFDPILASESEHCKRGGIFQELQEKADVSG